MNQGDLQGSQEVKEPDSADARDRSEGWRHYDVEMGCVKGTSEAVEVHYTAVVEGRWLAGNSSEQMAVDFHDLVPTGKRRWGALAGRVQREVGAVHENLG